jgi:sulfate transport system ATP-binding protein
MTTRRHLIQALAATALTASAFSAKLDRAVVVGPIARLELLPVESHADGSQTKLIEAHLTADRFKELGIKEGDTAVVAPRKVRVFLQPRVEA